MWAHTHAFTHSLTHIHKYTRSILEMIKQKHKNKNYILRNVIIFSKWNGAFNRFLAAIRLPEIHVCCSDNKRRFLFLRRDKLNYLLLWLLLLSCVFVCVCSGVWLLNLFQYLVFVRHRYDLLLWWLLLWYVYIFVFGWIYYLCDVKCLYAKLYTLLMSWQNFVAHEYLRWKLVTKYLPSFWSNRKAH